VFKRVVNVVEVLVLAGAVFAVVMLFAYRPGSVAGASRGAQIFAANCATCHGASGEGISGPKLAGGVVVRDFRNEDEQIAVVTNGRRGSAGTMPSFKGDLTPEQIKQVVEYTRTELAKK
jgi:mono/diheme cytochrome c family protein